MPTGMNTRNSAALIRGQLWSSQLKEQITDDLMATSYVKWLDEFPDGNSFTIPSIGNNLPVRDYQEDTDVVFDALDTGEFNFSITEYLSAGTYITKKALQDGYYMNQLQASFTPVQRRVIMERVESDIFGLQGQQVVGTANLINGHAHRLVGTGAGGNLSVTDFSRAKLSLKKARMPMSNLVAIVDPSVAFVLENDPNFINFSNNPKWEGIVAEGLTTGMRFIKNVFGFDVYESNYLSQDVVETINGVVAPAQNAVSMFFSAEQSVLPFVGAWRQMPEVESEWIKNKQREEHLTTARYGVKLYRPENLVSVIANTAV